MTDSITATMTAPPVRRRLVCSALSGWTWSGGP